MEGLGAEQRQGWQEWSLCLSQAMGISLISGDICLPAASDTPDPAGKDRSELRSLQPRIPEMSPAVLPRHPALPWPCWATPELKTTHPTGHWGQIWSRQVQRGWCQSCVLQAVLGLPQDWLQKGSVRER